MKWRVLLGVALLPAALIFGGCLKGDKPAVEMTPLDQAKAMAFPQIVILDAWTRDNRQLAELLALKYEVPIEKAMLLVKEHIAGPWSIDHLDTLQSPAEVEAYVQWMSPTNVGTRIVAWARDAGVPASKAAAMVIDARLLQRQQARSLE